jgi:addiction module HigA family antidote
MGGWRLVAGCAGNRRNAFDFIVTKAASDTTRLLSLKGIGMSTKIPPHPGDLIRTEIIEMLGLSVTQAADLLGVSHAILYDLLNERACLSPQLAWRIETAFGPKAEHLLQMQLAYDIAEVRCSESGIRMMH